MRPWLPSPVIAALVALWLQFWWSLVPTWRYGEYYGYGWLVPPMALFFAVRRWGTAGEKGWLNGREERNVPLWLTCSLMGALMILPVMRAVELADPGWRPPLLLQAALVAGINHALLARAFGGRTSWLMAPVTLFTLSAVPWPGQVERGMIERLTGLVVSFTSEIFLLTGKPVEVSGDRLMLGSQVVEVTEGCSGIRSLQSLIMAALFFGELLLLPWVRRIGLVLLAALCALVVNTGRAWALAEVQFSRGKEAAAAAHDTIGHLAFGVSAGLLFLTAWLLQRERQRSVVVRRVKTVESGPLSPLSGSGAARTPVDGPLP